MSSSEETKPTSQTQSSLALSEEEKSPANPISNSISNPSSDAYPNSNSNPNSTKRNSVKKEAVTEDVEYIRQLNEMENQHMATSALLENLNNSRRKTLTNSIDDSTNANGTVSSSRPQTTAHHSSRDSTNSTSENENDLTPSPVPPAYIHQKNSSIPKQGILQQPLQVQRSDPQNFMPYNNYQQPILVVANNPPAHPYHSTVSTTRSDQMQNMDVVQILLSATIVCVGAYVVYRWIFGSNGNENGSDGEIGDNTWTRLRQARPPRAPGGWPRRG